MPPRKNLQHKLFERFGGEAVGGGNDARDCEKSVGIVEADDGIFGEIGANLTQEDGLSVMGE